MPDNFFKITFKWLAMLLLINFLTNYFIYFSMQEFGVGGFTQRESLFKIVIPLISALAYFITIGFGLRNLSRSNQYEISVGSVFGFLAIMVFVPVLANYGMLYYRSLSDDNLAEFFTNPSYRLSLLVGVLFNVILGIIILTYASLWRIFRKAGKKGWYALIPIYNLIIICDIIKKDRSLVFLFFVPIMNLVGQATITNGMAKVFGKSTAFSVGLFFLPFIFFPILAFGKNEYIHNEYEVVNEDLDLDLEDHLVE